MNTLEQRARLQEAWNFAAADKQRGTDPASTVAELVARFGAVRSVSPSKSSATLRCRGVVASRRGADLGELLKGWMANASMKLIMGSWA